MTLNRLSWERQAHKDRIKIILANQTPQLLGELKARMDRVKNLSEVISMRLESKRKYRGSLIGVNHSLEATLLTW